MAVNEQISLTLSPLGNLQFLQSMNNQTDNSWKYKWAESCVYVRGSLAKIMLALGFQNKSLLWFNCKWDKDDVIAKIVKCEMWPTTQKWAEVEGFGGTKKNIVWDLLCGLTWGTVVRCYWVRTPVEQQHRGGVAVESLLFDKIHQSPKIVWGSHILHFIINNHKFWNYTQGFLSF